MKHKRYSSDLRAQDWQLIDSLIATSRMGKWQMEEVVNAIFYKQKNNCLWYDLPGDFPPWNSVLYYFKKWNADGTWRRINERLLHHYGKQAPCQKTKQQSPNRVIFDLSWMKHRAHSAPVHPTC